MKERLRKIGWRKGFQILFSIILMYVLYTLGLSLYFIVLFGIVILLLIIFKGKLYKKLEDFLSRKFPFLSKLNPWIRKLIIVVIFILIYMLLKQIIFLLLKMAGVDIQGMLAESINQSIN